MAAVETVSAAMAGALRRGRERMNAQFAAARASHPALEGATVLHHLREIISPMAEAVNAVRSADVDAVVAAAYELSLELMASGLLGDAPRYPAIVDGWRTIAPAAPWLLASDPRAFLGSITNAIHNLAQQRDARPEVWAVEMAAIAPAVADVGSFRAAGHVVAWRCGMPQHRLAALQSCATLLPPLALRALGVADTDASQLPHALERLRADPWLNPQAAFAAQAPRTLKMVGVAGAFRGFGGNFIAPPRVVTTACGTFVVSDPRSSWAMLADVFGVALLPLADSPPAERVATPFRFDDAGNAAAGEQRQRFEGLANPTSFAADGTTLVVTIDQSHQLFLIALQ